MKLVSAKKEDKDYKNVRAVGLKESWACPLTDSIDGLGTLGPISGTAPCSPFSLSPPHPHDETGAQDPIHSMPHCVLFICTKSLELFLLPVSIS